MAFARLTDLHPLHGACSTHETAWRIDCSELEELRGAAGWACQICRRTPYSGLVTDHDHAIGKHAIRGTLCWRCNSNYMGWIDAGICPIEPAAGGYIRRPWYLVRDGRELEYDPAVHVSVDDLSVADRREIRRLHNPAWSLLESRVRELRPRFEHPGVAAAVAAGDLRPALRLIRMALIWHRPDLDIALYGPGVPGGTGAPQYGGSIQLSARRAGQGSQI